jgi:hypothetical protein
MGKLRPYKITPNIFPDPKLRKNHQLTFSNVSTFLKVESLVISPYSFKVHMVFNLDNKCCEKLWIVIHNQSTTVTYMPVRHYKTI